ncbi:MAG: hypothetical protein Q8S15_00310 [Erysipelotrichaceae bacterium]|nr:hypothetical protein [Erysipelotrichaceae bacterium]MDP3304508.1 hypothetical protein [Erysipelotrichaceae bacterium]
MSKKPARIIITIVSVLVLAFFGMILGLLTGMNIGGNYFTDFEFMGDRGYIATGNIGLFIGLILGALTGFLLSRLLTKRK